MLDQNTKNRDTVLPQASILTEIYYTKGFNLFAPQDKNVLVNK